MTKRFLLITFVIGLFFLLGFVAVRYCSRPSAAIRQSAQPQVIKGHPD